MNRKKNAFSAMQYCPRCDEDTVHEVQIVGDVQWQRCEACHHENRIDYRKLRKLVRNIMRGLNDKALTKFLGNE